VSSGGVHSDASRRSFRAVLTDGARKLKSSAKNAFQKRPQSAESDSEDESSHPPRKPVGTSRSAIYDRQARDALRAGIDVLDESRYADWLEKVETIDPKFEFKPGSAADWRCSSCMGWMKTKVPYDTTRIKTHFKSCSDTSKKPQRMTHTKHTHRITSFFAPAGRKANSSPVPGTSTSTS
jgi:hypothetical protein